MTPFHAMSFETVGDITDVEVIATGRGIRRLKYLQSRHGGRRWRKLKGKATVRLIHNYEGSEIDIFVRSLRS